MKRLFVSATLFFFLCNAFFVDADEKQNTDSDNIRYHLKKIRDEMPILDLSKKAAHSESAKKYFDYYGLNFKNTHHYFGSFNSKKIVVACHVFLPDTLKGTVLLLHGYLDHSGILKNLIRNSLESGYAVAAFDLPGHGLSSGKRADVDDFSQYVSALDDFMVKYGADLPGPLNLISHSTGCAVVFDYLSEFKDNRVSKVIFLAPLVHSAYWKISKTGVYFLGSFLKTVKRSFPNNSRDKDFIEFIKNDPLQAKKIPIGWLKALYSWNKRVQTYDVLSKKVLIIQGAEDTVVDWKYNIKFFRKKIKPLEVKIIKNAGHQLINEIDPERSIVFDMINDELVKSITDG